MRDLGGAMLTPEQRDETAEEAVNCVSVLSMYVADLTLCLGRAESSADVDLQLSKLRALIVARDLVKAGHEIE